MAVTVRVGAVHLGWDVVSVAAGGGGTPIRPVQVEGTYTPPAYLLADSSGRLHTAGVERQRPDLGMAIADVRDILGHPQIVIAGATWPAELVFRARMYNPLAAVGKYLRGKPDLVALPFPDGWPDEKVDIYVELVEKLDVIVEPLPESVALSGYVRALGLVQRPDERNPRGVGATGVYSDGRTMLVVAVHGDDEQPTESVDVPVTAEAMRDARSADNVVIEVMAAARSIGADTSTVLLSGNVCFNDALRLAFQNHLGHRLRVADHPMHALVLGASHLLVNDNEDGAPESAGQHAEEMQARPDLARPGSPESVQYQPESAQRQPEPAQRQSETQQSLPELSQVHLDTSQVRSEPMAAHRESDSVRPEHAQARPVPQVPPVVQYGPGYPTSGPAAEPEASEEPTTRVSREDLQRMLPPNLAELGSRFTRPPGQHTGEQQAVHGRPPQGAGPPQTPGPPGSGPVQAAGLGAPVPPRNPYQSQPPGAEQDRRGQWEPSESQGDESKQHKGKLWGKLFGTQSVLSVVALAAVAMPGGAERVDLAASVVEFAPTACPLTPRVTDQQRQGIAAVRGNSREPADVGADCVQPDVDNLRYLVPRLPGPTDPGPPFHI